MNQSFLTLSGYSLFYILAFTPLVYPQVTDFQRDKSDRLIKSSSRHFRKGEREKGKEALRQAMKTDPSYYKPHFRLGVYYYSSKMYNLSAREFLFARQKYEKEYDKNSFSSRLRQILELLGESRIQLDQYHRALEVFKTSLSYDDRDTSNYSRIAWIYFKLNKLNKSRKMVNRCLNISKLDVGCLNISGILYVKERRYEKALEVYDKAVSLQLEVRANNMGELYKSLFQYDIAIKQFRLAIENSSANGTQSALFPLNISDIYINELKLGISKGVLDNYLSLHFRDLSRGLSPARDLGLIYLSKARTAYYKGDLHEAKTLLEKAEDYKQHFGSVGFSLSHYKYLVLYMKSLVNRGLANYKDEAIGLSVLEKISRLWDQWELKWQSSWDMDKAAEIAVDQLKQLNDLYIYETESIFDYGSLSEMLIEFDTDLMIKKLNQLLGQESGGKPDQRDHAKGFYYLYLGHIYLDDGRYRQALGYIRTSLRYFNAHEKTLKLKAYSLLAMIYDELNQSRDKNNSLNLIYQIHPPYLRLRGQNLPVIVSEIKGDIGSIDPDDIEDIRDDLLDDLSDKRFDLYDSRKLSSEKISELKDNNVNYEVQMILAQKEKGYFLRLSLVEGESGLVKKSVEESIDIKEYNVSFIKVINRFSESCFRYEPTDDES